MDKAFVGSVSTHLTLHALCSASIGAGVWTLGRRLLTLVLQFGLLGVQHLFAFWTLQLLVWLLNTLRETGRQLTLTPLTNVSNICMPNWKYLYAPT